MPPPQSGCGIQGDAEVYIEYKRYQKPDFWNSCLGGVQGKRPTNRLGQEKMFVKYAMRKVNGII
jgi:hypothetical protein